MENIMATDKSSASGRFHFCFKFSSSLKQESFPASDRNLSDARGRPLVMVSYFLHIGRRPPQSAAGSLPRLIGFPTTFPVLPAVWRKAAPCAPLRPGAEPGRAASAGCGLAGNACSQAVKYALTMISPFFGCALVALLEIFYGIFVPLSSTRDAQPAAKLVLDKLTFLCIGCKIGNQEEEKPWKPLRLAICDDLPEEREALLALLETGPPSPPFAPSSPAVRNCWKRSALAGSICC